MAKKTQKTMKVKTHTGKQLATKQDTPVVWNPFSMMSDVNSLFMNDPWVNSLLRHWGWNTPWAGLWAGRDIKEVPIDMIDNGKAFKIIAEMPGVSKEDIDITITPDNISICGKTDTETKTQDEGYIRQERSYSTLCRTMVFPTEVNPDAAEASLRDGILEINVKKQEHDKGKHRTVPVK